MSINFEEEVNRNQTACLKYDGRSLFHKKEDQIPLWIADMDLHSPECVNAAIEKRMQHRLYGYNYASPSYYNSIISWMKKRHGYVVEKEEIVPFPGVVPAISFLYQAFLNKGDSILIQEPVYGPFKGQALKGGYRVVNSQLLYNDGLYTIDFEDFELKIIENRVKIFVLCNPHNPCGRVWTEEELTKLATICVKHQVIVISDEIHSDLVFQPNHHIPLPMISKEIQDLCVVCTAPTKTFNLAGMKVSNIIIHNNKLREKFLEECEKYDLVSLHTFSYVACESVYTDGEEWLEALLVHLSENYRSLQACLDQHSGVRLIQPEATYLAWIDVTDLGYSLEEIKQRFEDHKLWVEFNDEFEEEQKRIFARINIAVSTKKLNIVLEHLNHILKKENINE